MDSITIPKHSFTTYALHLCQYRRQNNKLSFDSVCCNRIPQMVQEMVCAYNIPLSSQMVCKKVKDYHGCFLGWLLQKQTKFTVALGTNFYGENAQPFLAEKWLFPKENRRKQKYQSDCLYSFNKQNRNILTSREMCSIKTSIVPAKMTTYLSTMLSEMDTFLSSSIGCHARILKC